MSSRDIVRSGLPKRAANIEFEEAVDGLVAYQGERCNVCYLNPSAALILSLCSGSVTVERIAVLVAKAFSLPAPPLDDVEQSLLQLTEEGLIEWVTDKPITERGYQDVTD